MIPVGEDLTKRAVDSAKRAVGGMKEHTQKASKRNKDIAALQLLLWNSGAFNGVIDKRTGKLVTYERAVDGMMGGMTRLAMENNKLKRDSIKINVPSSQQTKKEQSNISTQKYTSILPEDRKPFGEWLYKEGQDNMVGNVFDVLSALTKNFTGIGNLINVGEGTLKQMVGYHLFDNLELILNGDTIKHHLGKYKNKDVYRWADLNGGEESHNKRSLVYNATMRPGLYIGGLYTMIETPNNFHISDTYNFNLSGTDYANKKREGSEATTYDKLRYYVGTYGTNKDVPFEQDIPMEKVLKWYNDFKLGKSVYNRRLEKNEEYVKKGYIGTGRLVYL